jgi:hypothetical protein
METQAAEAAAAVVLMAAAVLQQHCSGCMPVLLVSVLPANVRSRYSIAAGVL